MQIIGITGATGSGKTSLAKAFLRQIPGTQFAESGQLIAEVANALNLHYITARPNLKYIGSVNAWLAILPDAIHQATGYIGTIKPIHLMDPDTLTTSTDFKALGEYLTMVEANHGLVTGQVNSETKASYRPLLNWLGAYVTKNVDPTLWYKKLLKEAATANKDGCKLFVIGGVRFPSDGQVIKNAGGKVIAVERPNLPAPENPDPTEAYQSLITKDATVLNDSLVGALDPIAISIWRDLVNRDLKPRYQASRAGFEASSGPDIKARGIL